jgi:hypothetical protein
MMAALNVPVRLFDATGAAALSCVLCRERKAGERGD